MSRDSVLEKKRRNCFFLVLLISCICSAKKQTGVAEIQRVAAQNTKAIALLKKRVTEFENTPVLWLNDLSDHKEALFIAAHAVRDVFNKTFTATFKDVPLDVLHASSFDSFLNKNYNAALARFKNDPKRCFFVIAPTEEGKIAGFAVLIIHPGSSTGFLRLMAVAPEFQGNGIAKMLFYALQLKFPEMKRLTLLTRIPNVKAQQFYEHLGFKKRPCKAIRAEANPNVFVGYEWLEKS